MGRGLITLVLDLSVPALVALLVPACDIRLGIMTGRKTHLFLRGGGLFNLTHKRHNKSQPLQVGQIQPWNETRLPGCQENESLKPLVRWKRWSCHSLEFRQDCVKGVSLIQRSGGVLWFVCAGGQLKGVEQCCLALVGELLDVIKWPFWFGSLSFYNKRIGCHTERAVSWGGNKNECLSWCLSDCK